MARAVQPCGTTAAYQRHRRRGEDPCDDCRRAWREAKAAKDQARRSAGAVAAQSARPAAAPFDQRVILEEVLSNLRGQLAEAPPQSVAGIAKQIRDTASELAQLTGKSPALSSVQGGGGVDDIAARRAEREARRRSASQG